MEIRLCRSVQNVGPNKKMRYGMQGCDFIVLFGVETAKGTYKFV